MKAIMLLCVLHAAFGQLPNYGWNGQNQLPSSSPAGVVTDCNSDQASCSCCLMQRKMQRMEQLFNSTVSEISKQLASSKTNINSVKTSRSVFSVALNNASALTCVGPNANDAPIIYKYTFYNTGGYSTQTGIFTAPLSGVYSLAVSIYSVTSADKSQASCASLLVNGNVVSSLSDRNGLDVEDSSTSVLAITLKAGDQVSVSLLSGCNICDSFNHFNTFTGFLLYAV
ncbi:cerebellin-3 isoform X2 [Nothobranchius furzeri]|uniref:LOC107374048-like protein n=1 Tax=Nothobranchius furzeri TaxID=105023 RepID=A0A1A8U8L1_NOTFU|nr:uncharacterized protein cbln20 [Nothobranchius furzeri]XP_054591080.1 uncharacterized protein cbln20 [Nothobranchius furzeri]XP_054591081.1 uncharacterized protein cbln20 [Nothobranchius furzeri]KAF7219559.1 putative LOC107374048-like protein [Nothobranchius furzeri]